MNQPPHTPEIVPTPSTQEPALPLFSQEPAISPGAEAALPPDTDAAEGLADQAYNPQRLQRRSFGRWLVLAPIRLSYRLWTRIAVRLFPEDTHQARLAERVGLPLPDRLDISWVTDTLAVGGRVRPDDIARLAQTGITRVVDTRAEYRDDEAALNRAGIHLLYLPTPDTYPLTIEQLLEGAEWIWQQRQAGQRVLIHCEHGVGRSVLLTCAALVRDGLSAEQAIHLVQAKRWQASPNHRQIKRLYEFAEVLRADAQNRPDQAGEQPEHAV